MQTNVKSIRSIRLLLLAGVLAIASPSCLAQASAQGQIDTIKSQIDQLKLDIEVQKSAQMNDRAKRNERGAKAREATIQSHQITITNLNMEMQLYQQQLTLEKQAKSPNAGIAAIQTDIQQLTLDKGRFAIMQAKANQKGDKNGANSYAQQMAAKDRTIKAKQEQMKLLELQQKVGR